MRLTLPRQALGGERARPDTTLRTPPTDPFYGERSGRLRDRFGHTRLVGHSIESVEPAEVQRGYTALLAEST